MISRKIGPHIISGTSAPIGRPTFVKLVDVSVEYYREVRNVVGPECLIEVRWTEPNDYQPLDDPERRAQEWWNRRKGWILSVADPNVVYAGYNEIPDELADAFCLFELERLRCLHQWDRAGAVLSASVGCPNIPIWDTYDPVLKAMGPRDVVDLHEYYVDYEDIDNVWHVCRFTIPEVAAHLAGKRIVISEHGRDLVEGKGAAGWQHTTDGKGFLRDLEKSGAKYHAIPAVVGVAVYQLGSNDPKWRAFDCYGIWPTLVYSYDPADPPITAPSIPAPAPAPAPAPPTLLQPVERYVRISQGWNPPIHYGIDYSCYTGTTVLAPVSGVARCLTDTAANGGFGKYIRIETGQFRVYLAHLDRWAVSDRSKVTAGQPVAFSGNTGNSSGPHLHLEIRANAGSPYLHGAIDPTPLLKAPESVLHLPSNDALTLAAIQTGDLAQIWPKRRWWNEQAVRDLEDGKTDRALAILRDMADPRHGLDYIIERLLAGQS